MRLLILYWIVNLRFHQPRRKSYIYILDKVIKSKKIYLDPLRRYSYNKQHYSTRYMTVTNIVILKFIKKGGISQCATPIFVTTIRLIK